MATSGKKTWQYRNMIACRAALTDAIAKNLTGVCPRLVTVKLIDDDESQEFTNDYIKSKKRAADLVSAITDRVSRNTKHFDTFVRVLEEDEIDRYEDIVKDLLKQGDTADKEPTALPQSSPAPPTSEDPSHSSPPSSVVRTVAEPSSSVNVVCERELLKLCTDQQSDITKVKHLLNQQAVDPNFYDEKGRSLMWWACSNGLTSVVTLLLDSGAYVNIKNDDEGGETPLFCASYRGRVAVCRVLLERGATVDFLTKQGDTALYIASQFGRKDVVELLLDSGASVNKENMDIGFTALRIASVEGHTEVASVLIARGAVVDYQDKEQVTPLFMACQNSHKEVAQLLLHSGAQPNIQRKDSITPLILAGQEGYRDICQLLLEHGANVNHQLTENGWSALHFASAHGRLSIVELFIKSGAQLDVQTKAGQTALALAAYGGHIQIVHILLNAGASPDIHGQDGLTALMVALQRGHEEVIQSLLENKVKTTGRSAIFFTVEDGNIKIIKVFVSGGADVDLKDKNDLTALDTASPHLAGKTRREENCDL